MAGVPVVSTPEEARAACAEARLQGKRVGLVPTMGALHEGHLELVRAAAKACDWVVCSIFVNPTQFGPNEDFARYPRDVEGDVTKLATARADLVFTPEIAAMYAPGDETRVRVTALARHLCGPHRPGHFEGVTTVVAKLFGIVGPCLSIFGKKDYQQLAILRRMACDLFMPIEVRGHPIVREPDGVAMSSRNAYLTTDERARARGLSRGLGAAARAFEGGERRAGVLRALVEAHVVPAATSVDYVSVADPDALVPFDDAQRVPPRALLAVACRIGQTRLIDNVVLGEDPTSALPT